MSQQLVRIFRATHTPDGAGGRTRQWNELQPNMLDIKLGGTRDSVTGATQVDEQEATITTHRWTLIQVNDRLLIGGFEFVVTGLDPQGPKITRKVYAKRVTHEELDHG